MEDIISMSPLHIQVLIIGLAVIAIAVAVYFSIDGFDSDPQAGTRGCDPSCSNGGYSKITGKPCCNTGNTSVDNDDKICVKLPNGTTECHNSGATGDTKGNRTGNVSSWDGNAAGDAGRTSASLGAGDRDLGLTGDLSNPYKGLRRGRGGSDELSVDELELLQRSKLYSGRNGSMYGKSGDDKKYKRKTVDELLNDSRNDKDTAGTRDGSKGGSWSNSNKWSNGSYGPKGSYWSSEDEERHRSPPKFDPTLRDNRLRSERSFERPSEKPYNKGARKGHDSCNKYKTCDDNEEEEDVCEGFSPLL